MMKRPEDFNEIIHKIAEDKAYKHIKHCMRARGIERTEDLINNLY